MRGGARRGLLGRPRTDQKTDDSRSARPREGFHVSEIVRSSPNLSPVHRAARKTRMSALTARVLMLVQVVRASSDTHAAMFPIHETRDCDRLLAHVVRRSP